MTTYYLIPSWFSIFGSITELLFGVVAISTAILAFRVYSLSNEPKIRNFSLGFGMIGLSYIIWSFINILITKTIAQGGTIVLEELAETWVLGVYSQIVLFVAGLALLAYATLDVRKPGIFYLFLGLSLTAISASLHKLITFRIVAVFILSYLAYHYFWEYSREKNRRTLRVFIAFTLLFLSSLLYVIGINSPLTFVIGHILELLAYSLILVTLIKTLKNKK